jgi:acetyltransferase-like isoleucine patch superfamily enzyme
MRGGGTARSSQRSAIPAGYTARLAAVVGVREIVCSGSVLRLKRLRRIREIAISRLRARYRGRRAELGEGVRFGSNVNCRIAPGGRLVIGDHVEVGALTTFAVASGGELLIGDRVFISGYCTVAAERHVSIGSESMLGEMVSIRDHDHDPAYPPRSGRSQQADVRIGSRVWIAAKASVIRGTEIGDDAVIGAHAVVNLPVPARSLAAGVPARIIRNEIKADR